MTTGVVLVAKKNQQSAGDGPRKPGKTTVKLDVDLHRRARTVASDLSLELTEYLAQVLKPIVDKAYHELGQRISKEGDKK